MKNVGHLACEFDVDQRELKSASGSLNFLLTKMLRDCLQVIPFVVKSTQVHTRPGQTDSQVDPSLQLASTCESVWLGLYGNNKRTDCLMYA